MASPTTRWRFAVVLGVAAAVAAVLIGASQIGAGDGEATARTTTPTSTDPARAVQSLFAGIEQQGLALGSPAAPVTLVEYADLQCPDLRSVVARDAAGPSPGICREREG